MLSSFILQLFFLLCSLTNPITQAYHQLDCYPDENYTWTSSFWPNLNKLLSSLPINAIKNDRFFVDTVGKFPDDQFAYGLAMCHYDTSSIESCTTCLTEVARNITLECPKSKDAILYQDDCFIHFANYSFFSLRDDMAHLLPNKTQNISDPIFHRVVIDLMYKLAVDVASSPKLFAIGEAQYTTSIKVYALAECTRDVSPDLCQRCIETYARYRNETLSYPEAIGYRLIGPTCYTRYEVYPFYNLVSPPSPPPISPPVPLSGSKSNNVVIIVVVVSVGLLAMLAIAGLGIFFSIRSRLTQENTEYKVFDLITLKEATDKFSDKNMLGRGGFGLVYKATLQDGIELAVKRLATTSVQGIVELKNEIELLTTLKHINLVKVLGYCIHEEEKLLCYEYLINGSLDMFLFSSDIMKRKVLDWNTRFNVIVGICRGLVYLHVESGDTIIHRDLKASNILLDKDMNPKISDFGLARFIGNETHKTTANFAGTLGYIAPEYLKQFRFSPKSDVFSFGVLILEIVTGRRCCPNGLISHTKEEIMELKDETLPKTCHDQVEKCIHIGLLCVQEEPENRPSIYEVNIMLHHPSSLPMLPHPSSLPPITPANFDLEAEISEDSSHSAST